MGVPVRYVTKALPTKVLLSKIQTASFIRKSTLHSARHGYELAIMLLLYPRIKKILISRINRGFVGLCSLLQKEEIN
jgi:hypothetical protein